MRPETPFRRIRRTHFCAPHSRFDVTSHVPLFYSMADKWRTLILSNWVIIFNIHSRLRTTSLMGESLRGNPKELNSADGSCSNKRQYHMYLSISQQSRTNTFRTDFALPYVILLWQILANCLVLLVVWVLQGRPARTYFSVNQIYTVKRRCWHIYSVQRNWILSL